MTYEHFGHLTLEDYDAWTAGKLSPSAEAHLVGCPECSAMLQAEQEMLAEVAALQLHTPGPGFADRVVTRMRAEQQIDALLGALPLFDPTPGFEDRVIAAVVPARPSWHRALRTLPVRIFATPRSIAAAAMVALTLAGSLTWSVLWSLAHQDAMAALGTSLLADAQTLLWVAVRSTASTLIQQPWYEDARVLLGTPTRFVSALVLVSALYAGGVLAFRRLLTAPNPNVTHAH